MGMMKKFFISFLGICFLDILFALPNRILEIPTPWFAPVEPYWEGGLSTSTADLSLHPLDLNLHFYYKSREYEIAFSMFGWTDYAIDFGYIIKREDKYLLQIGVDNITYRKYITTVGQHGFYDEQYAHRQPEVFSIYAVGRIQCDEAGKLFAYVGLGRGKFIGYGPLSKFMNLDILLHSYNPLIIGLFLGVKYYFEDRFCGMIELTGRNVNIGLQYLGEYAEISCGWLKLEHLRSIGKQSIYEYLFPRVFFTFGIHKKLPIAKPLAYKAPKEELYIFGKILDAKTKKPIKGIKLAVIPSSAYGSFEIHENGSYMLMLRAKKCKVKIEAPNYFPVIKDVVLKTGLKEVNFFLERAGPPAGKRVVGTVTGRIVDGKTGKPVPGVRISIIPSSASKSFKISQDGTYTIELLKPKCKIKVSAKGYKSVAKMINLTKGTYVVNFYLHKLTPSPTDYNKRLKIKVYDEESRKKVKDIKANISEGSAEILTITEGEIDVMAYSPEFKITIMATGYETVQKKVKEEEKIVKVYLKRKKIKKLPIPQTTQNVIITGIIRDIKTGKPISKVNFVTQPAGLIKSKTVYPDGRYRIELKKGGCILKISAQGYFTEEVKITSAKKIIKQNFSLRPR